MTAKEYLSQYREAVKDIRCMNDDLESLRADATDISPATSSGAHTKGNISDKVGKKAPAIVDLEREIEEQKAAARQLRRDIRKTIWTLPQGNLRRLLNYYYVCNFTWERVAVKMNMSYVHVVHRLHPRALRAVGNTSTEISEK